MLETILINTSLVIVVYYLVIYTFYALLILCSIPSIHKRFREVNTEDITRYIQSETLPSISIIVPVYSEEEKVLSSIDCLSKLSYPTKEIIFVHDGSKTRTMDILRKKLDLMEILPPLPAALETKPVKKMYRSKLHPEITVVDKESGGKSDAINAGLNASVSTLFLVLDADTLLEKDAILRMIRPFFAREKIVGQGGTLRILNGCEIKDGEIHSVALPKKLLAGIQVVEYLRAFLYGRLGWNYLGGNLIISGAFGLFDRKAIIECGGYDPESIGEDFEITTRLTKKQKLQGVGLSVLYIPDPVAWTGVPDNYEWLSRQRARWHQGLMEVMWKNKDMIFNPRYGWTGMVTLPFYLFGELLQPFAELLGYVLMTVGLAIGYLDWYLPLLFILVAWGITIILTIISILMEITTFRRYCYFSQFMRLLFYALLENLGYRQMYLWWKIRGMIAYFRKSKTW